MHPQYVLVPLDLATMSRWCVYGECVEVEETGDIRRLIMGVGYSTSEPCRIYV